MLDIFSGLRLVVKRRNISIDNAIFRCHWFFTSTLLVSFSLIITARQYVGQPIECHSINKIPDSLLNSYCWVQSTFTVPQACNQNVGFEVPYPCIDNTRGREIKVFAYYQWVGIVLFIQGLLFHLPYYLWKVWENGLIKAITGGLRIAVLSDQERAKKRDIVVEYIHDHLGCHKRYALKYFVCETICLFNLLGQLWATNKFFDGQFLRYGIDVMEYSSSTISSQFAKSSTSSSNNQQSANSNQALNYTIVTTKIPSDSIPYQVGRQAKAFMSQPLQRTQVDPMTYIFPRMTKCTYYDFGSSGDVQKHDALCLLPLNIINEKIYIALWFWFLILAILTVIVIIYRLFAIVSESVRCKGLISRCKLSNEQDIRVICRHCDVGDWFLFYMVAENLDPLIMREIVSSVADKIRAHLQLKQALGLGPGQSELSNDPHRDIKKYRPSISCDTYRAGSFEDETLTACSLSRRNSIADEIPLVRKIKKRFYSKRLWSDELGPPEWRQQMFGTAGSAQRPRQPSSNPDHAESALIGVVSAPPISQMPLDSSGVRRASLTRTMSNNSNSSQASDSHVLEMPTISGSDHQGASYQRRRSSVYVKAPLLRQRRLSSISNYRGHSHHQSMSSIRELRPPEDTDWLVDLHDTQADATQPKQFAHQLGP